MYRVIILDTLAQEGLDLLKQAPGVEFEVRTGLKGDALREALAGADGAICRSGVQIDAAALEGNRRLRAIARAGVGTDNIDKDAATRRGIVVMNTPGGNTISTAEHTFALMLALSRNLAPAHQSLVEGKWNRNAYMGTQLADKTLGIIGLGRIGREIASRARAFQMRVLGYDPFVSPDQAEKMGIEMVDKVRDMLPRVDFLTVHTPKTPETTKLIGQAELELLKPGVRLINCARGGIYDEAALVEGLRSGKLAGVALDVYEKEPCTDSPLFRMPGTLCSPHLGASTEEAQTQVAIEAVQLMLAYLTTGEIRHAVNAASLDPLVLQALRGYLDVAYRLGLFMAQWVPSAISTCRLSYRGEVTKRATSLLTSAFCAGLLTRALDQEANIVNAQVLLRERGIELVEQSRSGMGPFSSSIRAELECESGTFTASGTLFGNEMPRLIQLNDYRLEAYLDGTLMLFAHEDRPGIIGAIGTVFGQHRVNIAQMSVGRAGQQPGGQAIGVLNLDDVPPPEALSAMLHLDGIQKAQVIQLPPAGKGPAWLVG